MSAKKMTIVLICCLLVVLGTAVCALLELYPQDVLVAAAEDKALPSFVIATADGENWTLSFNSQNVDGAECRGAFIEANNHNCVAFKMYEAIKTCLRESGADVPDKDDFTIANYCDISFKLPDIVSSVEQNTAEYGSQGVFFGARILQIISSPSVAFEYKKEGGEWQRAYADYTAGGYLFGRGVDAGEYQVRLVATEKIRYEVNKQLVPFEYESVRYGQTFACTIEKAELSAQKQPKKSFVYGASLSDMANSLESTDFCDANVQGRFVPSAAQTDEALASVADINSAYLGVKDGGHVVYFDFIPDSDNYKPLEQIAVQINVSPRTLYVRIRDAYSLAGEAFVIPKYQIVSALVGSDTEADLGVSFEYEADKDVPSMSYRSYIAFSNPNYTPDCHSYESQFANYGRYFVYAKQVEVVADDGQIFYAFFGSGLMDVIVKASRVEVENKYGRPVYAAYKFEFSDGDGNDVTPEEAFSITWKNTPEIVEYFTVYGKDELLDISENGMVLSKQYNVICFIEGNSMAKAFTPANIALATICGVLALTVVALCVAWKKQKRYLV
mgnify:FL=1